MPKKIIQNVCCLFCFLSLILNEKVKITYALSVCKTLIVKYLDIPCSVLIIGHLLSCQTMRITKVTRLPPVLRESSGLIVVSDSLFWSHNDGGNLSELYQFNKQGKVLRTVTINTANKDWEELALDEKGNLYIADFGNNAQIRQDLAIFKIPNFIHRTTDSIFDVEKIAFFYPEQKAFPPLLPDRVFDAEAIIVKNDSIYIFTKDYYSMPYAGVTHVYAVPNQNTSAGKPHPARLCAILPTDKKSKMRGAITAAASNTEGVLLLLGYRKIYWIENFFSDKKNISLKPLKISLLNTAQREAIAFGKNDEVYLTSEKTKFIGGNLSKIRLKKYVKNKQKPAQKPKP